MTRSAVLPWIPQSNPPPSILPHLVQNGKTKPNILIFWNLYTRRYHSGGRSLTRPNRDRDLGSGRARLVIGGLAGSGGAASSAGSLPFRDWRAERCRAVSSADLSGPAVFRVIQCECPCRSVWVQDCFQGQSSLSGAIGKGPGRLSGQCHRQSDSGDILIGRLQSKVDKSDWFWKIGYCDVASS
jgi:hypothetical protein